MVKKASAAPKGAEADERRRLRSLAFSNGLLQRGEPAAPRAPLAPSTAVSRLQGRDILRRGGQRKSRFLFSFPGLLAPVASGGRIGELADLGTKNPVLYLEFPQVGSQVAQYFGFFLLLREAENATKMGFFLHT
jgi:hypothetical protein